MKTKITAMLLVLASAPVLAQSDYIDGEFEGRMGWIPDSDGTTEYYLGYSDGREEHEDLFEAWDRMQRESDSERRHDEFMDALRGLSDD